MASRLTVAAIVHHYEITPEMGFDAAKYDASFKVRTSVARLATATNTLTWKKEYGLWTHDTLCLNSL